VKVPEVVDIAQVVVIGVVGFTFEPHDEVRIPIAVEAAWVSEVTQVFGSTPVPAVQDVRRPKELISEFETISLPAPTLLRMLV
jgi:hypothetical protein